MTHIALPHPDTSWRRNRSLTTTIMSQNHMMKTKIVKASIRKFRNVKPSCAKNIGDPRRFSVVRQLEEHFGSAANLYIGGMSGCRRVSRNKSPPAVVRLDSAAIPSDRKS